MNLYYNEETRKELAAVFSRTKRIAQVLEHYLADLQSTILDDPETFPVIAMVPFDGRYVEWDRFEADLMQKIANEFALFPDSELAKCGINKQVVSELALRIFESMLKDRIKPEMKAWHDAYLLSLTRSIRESLSDWFKCKDWILTVDKTLYMYERYTLKDPVTIIPESIPVVFYAYAIAKSINRECEATLSSTYDLFIDCANIMAEWRNQLSSEAKHLQEINNDKDLVNHLMLNLKEVSSIEDVVNRTLTLRRISESFIGDKTYKIIVLGKELDIINEILDSGYIPSREQLEKLLEYGKYAEQQGYKRLLGDVETTIRKYLDVASKQHAEAEKRIQQYLEGEEENKLLEDARKFFARVLNVEAEQV